MTADALLQRLGARRPVGEMAHAGDLRGGQLQRVALVVVPAAQIDGVAAAPALGHAHDIDEEAQGSPRASASAARRGPGARGRRSGWWAARVLPRSGGLLPSKLPMGRSRGVAPREKSECRWEEADVTHGEAWPCRAGCSPALSRPPRPKTIRTGPSRSSCRSAPAGRPTSTRASSASTCRRRLKQSFVDREPAGRRLGHRHRRGRQVGARRLHAADDVQHPHHQRDAAAQQALPADARLRAGGAGQLLRPHHGRAPLGAGQGPRRSSSPC